MKKKWIVLVISMTCLAGVSVYAYGIVSNEMSERKLVAENARPVRPDDVVVYNDGEHIVTMSKEDYEALPESKKQKLEHKYKVLFERLENKK